MSLKRKLRKIVGFDLVKGTAVRLFAWLLRFKTLLPRPIFVAVLAVLGVLLKILWFVPFNPWRRAAKDLKALGAAGGSPRSLFYRLVDNARTAALGYLDIHRGGPAAVIPRIRMSDRAQAVFGEIAAGGGRGVFILPHVVGGFFTGVFVAQTHKIMLLYRGPRSPGRAAVQKSLVAPLGLDLLELDRESAVTAARQFLTALKEGTLIVGHTDLLHKRDDTVESVIFGRPAHLPSWPARFARQARVPIAVGYVRIRDGIFEIDTADLIRARDVAEATRMWASEFERFILSAPWEWAFLSDLRWGRFLAEAAAARRGAP